MLVLENAGGIYSLKLKSESMVSEIGFAFYLQCLGERVKQMLDLFFLGIFSRIQTNLSI